MNLSQLSFILLWLFYNWVLVPFYWVAVHLLALFNPKIAQSIQARKNLISRWHQLVLAQSVSTGPSIWVHVSSVGEFLQAKPLMQKLKKNYPHCKIWLSLYSVSGRDWIKNKKEISPDWDGVDYLPWDTVFSVRQMLKILQPQIIILVKFDLWPNLIWEAHQQKIPVVLISATLSENSKRSMYGPVRALYKNLYSKLSLIAAVSHEDAARFKSAVPQHSAIFVTGDTRADSVLERQQAASHQAQSLLANFISQKFSQIVMVGSSWPEDEQRVLSGWQMFLHSEGAPFHSSILMVVPHEPSELAIQRLETQILNYRFTSLLWSDLLKQSPELWSQKLSSSSAAPLIVIVDVVGMLAEMYRIATIAYVGSGRGGVHNTLEPAAWGLPLLFGPRYHNAPEAISLIAQKAAISVSTPQEFASQIKLWFDHPQQVSQTGQRAKNFLLQSQGATAKCVEKLAPLI